MKLWDCEREASREIWEDIKTWQERLPGWIGAQSIWDFEAECPIFIMRSLSEHMLIDTIFPLGSRLLITFYVGLSTGPSEPSYDASMIY